MQANPLGLVFFPAFDWAISPTHPEREERLLYTRDQLVEEGLLDIPGIHEYKPRLATVRDVERVHLAVPDVSSLITDAHLISAGGAITAAEAVLKGEVQRAFALVRPPGHHAMRVVHGARGFCTINIEAIMIEYVRRHLGVGRVAIVDTDVHHGDGTQDIYYHDPDTLFISFHQDGRTLYPGSGFTQELGSPQALGTTINIPLPPGTTDEGLHYVLDELVLPVLDEFAPDIIINSAGQDNHYSDPLAGMAITAQGYARLADKLKADIAVLEGGYSIETALPYVNTGIILAMAGLDYSKVIEPDCKAAPMTRAANTAIIQSIVAEQKNMWLRRNELKSKALTQAGEYWERERNIYYDSSEIMEEQVEYLRLCPECQGFMTVKTQSNGQHSSYKSAFAAVIPRQPCRRCREQAKEAVETEKRRGGFQQYILQDRENDVVERFF
ncbi:MAG: hdaH [Firmicutes bacterium]|nr:hdaH [Bacillota bacterium]